MTRRLLEFHPKAAEELDAALMWYLERSRAAAESFVGEVDRALSVIADNPKRWPTHQHGTRRYLLQRFPFMIVYRPQREKVQVVAVAHGRRRPGYWRSRLT